MPLIEKKTLLITKASFTKIWHIFKAKAIAALEKYVSVSTFGYIVKIRFQWLNRFPYGPRQDGLKWAAIF